MGGALDSVLPSGTILSCPESGEGLYKVTARSTTEDLVMDDGSILVPLNLSTSRRMEGFGLSSVRGETAQGWADSHLATRMGLIFRLP